MSCVPVKMKDGTLVLANVKPGSKLTEAEKQSLAEWVQYCRDRTAARKVKEQRERNRRSK